MNKNYIQPQISVIHVDNADIICTSAPQNGRGKKVKGLKQYCYV